MFASLTSTCSVLVCLSKQNPQITTKTIQEPDSRTPTTSNRRHFFSSNPTRRRHSLISSLPIHPQIGGWLNLHGYSQQLPNPSPPPVMLAAMAFSSFHYFSFSLSSGYLYFLLLPSPAMVEHLLPLTPIAVGGAFHQCHNHWWLQVQLSYSLFSFSFILFFKFFFLPFRQDRNPFDTHFVSFFYQFDE